jgi:hypothetical protein
VDIRAPIPIPDKKELRKFAFIMAGMVALFFGLIVPWIWSLGVVVWAWVVAAVFAVWGVVWPGGLGPVYKFWMRFGLIVGWVNSRIILSLVFFLMFTPAALVMRLLGKDPMNRKLEPEGNSYRIDSQGAPPQHLERPY